MSHEPRLTIYTIHINPRRNNIERTNRNLFRHIIGEVTDDQLDDDYILTELFRSFINALDTPEMFSDKDTQKCMTAHQRNLADDAVDANLHISSEQMIFQGKVEGGKYGRRRNRTSTLDKTNRSEVGEDDAITDDFYFLLYLPPAEDKILLMLQSYSDDSIDSVMLKFLKNFFSVPDFYYKPKIHRYVPPSIIEDFKERTTVSSLEYTTTVAGETLLDETRIDTERNFIVTVKIKPIDGDLTMQQFEKTVSSFNKTIFTKTKNLSEFFKKRGTLRDNSTNKETPFELDSNFEIQPVILLRKYIVFPNDEMDFTLVRDYCFGLLDELKQQIYDHGISER